MDYLCAIIHQLDFLNRLFAGDVYSAEFLVLSLIAVGWSGSAEDKLCAFTVSVNLSSTIKLLKEMSISKAGTADINVRNDDRIAAAAGWDGRIRLYHAQKAKPLAILKV